jgi:4-amino-4-deoxy-L-arabinose transferase-like glycosyltransferase
MASPLFQRLGSLVQSPRKIQSFNLSLPVVGLILLSFAIAVYGINWGLPDWKAWAADELIPEKVLEAIDKQFANGWYYKYPPVQYYLLAILYSPLLMLKQLGWIKFDDLKTYTLLFYLGRSLSVVMGVGTILLIARLGEQVFDRRTGWLAAMGMTLTPLYVYYAKITNLDIPVLFWTIAFLICYIEILKHHRFRDYVIGAVLAAIAVCTKDQFYGFCILTPFFAIWHFWQTQRQTQPNFTLWQAARDRRVGYGLLAGIVAFLILQNALFNVEGFIDRFNLILYGGASIRPRYEESWRGQLEMLGQSFHHLQFSFGWPLWCMSILGLALYLWRCWKPQLSNQPRNWLPLYLWVPAVSYYLFYVAPILYNDVRYLMPLMPVMVLFAGYAMAQLVDRAKPWFVPGTMLTTMVFFYSLGYSWTINSLMANDSRYFVEEWMRSQIPPNELVLEVGIEKYLPRSTGFQVKTLEEPDLDQLNALNPRWIIVSSGYDHRRFPPDSKGYAFFKQLSKHELGYDVALSYQTLPKWYWFDRSEVTYRLLDDMKIYSNFDKIDPEITIYRSNKP